MFLLCCCIVLGLDVSVCFGCVVVLYWVLTFLYVFVVLLTKTYRNIKTQYNTTTQQNQTETPKPNTIQQHNKNIQKRQDPIQYNGFVVLLYCIGFWRFCMFLLCCCIVLGLDVSVCFGCVVVLYWVLTFLYVFVVYIQKRQDPIQYNNTTKTYRNVKTQYNTTTQQKHTERSRPNTIQQHNKNIHKRQDPLLCCCIVLAFDVSVCFCCAVVLYWVLTFLYVFVVLLYCIGSWRFCMFLLCCCIVLGLDVCQDPIQYNNTTKT
jgi:Ca2+/Na+ antiporter